MTEEQIKEAVSREFLRIIAHSHGFKTVENNLDHGVDIVVCPVMKYHPPQGGVRYLDSQYKLDFQLKATTLAGINDEGHQIKYDLEVKTFNDLVHRRGELLPLHLVVVVLNGSPPNCVTVGEAGISLSGQAYWYLPNEDAAHTENSRTVRITIPKTNRLELDFVRTRYEDLGIPL